ncbi:hypothetical protein CEUSTIGMA_g4337.t1 [Chlamydomonas eustigma]|uniref:26S proteasome non-ATPase regulatory subunit 1 homolog n=1 Tax=Chlamydomonas eustigma TaxID=1157962 RepID=A0A250X1E0_9CHLO|nr:hypothetical protein CEUSTIGMA_g4337.t1 [Chlamydomonas eustigma]|eukprot:GAX76891.1 hypothetical protein CEUSTIGMA_g4337.t1 [Chlamydomonas eustigma]
MSVSVMSGATGLLSLLSEPCQNDELKCHALVNINKVVDEYWFQISGSIASVEALYEDDEFSHRELAALVASKVFYHLGELDDALNYALGAGSLFNVNEESEFVNTLVSRCLDRYFELRVKEIEEKQEVDIDPRLTSVVERMINRCCEQGQFEQAVGVALEARRLDKLEEVIAQSADSVKTIKYSLAVCQKLIINRGFRQQVLRLLIRLYEGVPSPDYIDVCQCLMFLDDDKEVATILNKLLRGSKDDVALAYQVCFDLVENEMQSFLIKVQQHLDVLMPTPASATPTPLAPSVQTEGDVEMEQSDSAPPAASEASPLLAASNDTDANVLAQLGKAKDILSGKVPIGLYLDFMYRNNHADLLVLKGIKTAVESRNSVTHSATILANAYMHAGTTVDTFLRENLEWLSKATNWSKFSATAGLGVIHRGHLQQGQALMAPYLPRNGASGSPYSEGGALYALGLIYANHGHDVRSFLLNSLRNTSNEIIQHGACLGLGLASLGTEDAEIAEDIKNVLYSDSAVAGEAAGIGMGLLLAGSASEKAQELLSYAHETQHEKIIRGIVVGLAIIMYGREEGADTLIEQMIRDQDPIIRYGGMYVIGMAYRGTGNNGAVQQLLHFAVSDVSDDVRRAATLCLGFVLMNSPEQCPKIVSLLSESFNSHVRYGAAMAVGLACAGTGLKDAVSLLEPMLSDPTDFVRQGALIATALVMVQQPETRLGPLRKRIDKMIKDKHEEVMCKMGAIMAAGIIDAGGRNVTIGLRSQSGYFRRTSVVALAVFTQHWYWYPLTYFLSLAMQPTALIGLTDNLQMPTFQVECTCKPSIFAYPSPINVEKKEEASKVPTAVLSTTAKAKERAKKKEAEKKGTVKLEGDKMETDEKAAPASASTAGGEEGKEPGNAGGVEAAAAVTKEADVTGPYTLDNPTRVVPSQAKFIRFKAASRWTPIKSKVSSGILVMKDSSPDMAVDLVSPQVAAAAPAAVPAPTVPAPVRPPAQPVTQTEEPPPPEPFEYTP